MAYGEEISRQNYGTDTIRQKYTGYQKDTETDLDFAQARMYVSKLGRFSTSDPLMASANVINPQTFNRYSYVLNSPYNLIDPSGLAPEGKSGGRPAPMEDWGFGIWGNADAEARYEKDLAITREEMAKAQEKAKEDAQSGNVVALHEDLHEAATEEVTSQDENNTSESAESNENGEKPPKIKVITKINRNRTYNVAGADANTAIQNASIQCNNRQAQGCTNYRYPWRSTRSSRSNQVSTATVTLTVTITVTLPKWTGYKRASEAEKRIWDNFITRLRSHEEGHVQIAVAGAREVANAIPGRASTSKELGVIETANFNRAFATVVARQEAYDIRTNHGLNQ
jgi:RHS repeat-associated protein